MSRASALPWADRIQAAWLSRGRLARWLWPLSLAYRAGRFLHVLAFQVGWFARESLPVPVVVVGNLLAGGAGKTPTTLALIELLRRHGYTPGVISRGYGRLVRHIVQVSRNSTVEEAGDEPLLIHLRAEVPVVVCRDRVKAGQALLRAHPRVDVLISDDGLQHLRLRRDVEVLVFDERGIGNGWLLPAGPLREPFPAAQAPRHSVVVYNAGEPSTDWPGHLVERRLRGLVRLAEWWRGMAASPEAFAELMGQPVLAVAGLARPGRFFDMLRAQGLSIVECPLPDHDDFAVLPWPTDAAAVVVTEKDAVKLQPGREGTDNVWVATLDFSFDAAFEAEFLHRMARSGKQRRPTEALID